MRTPKKHLHMNADSSRSQTLRSKFDVKFYLVSILFLLFDLEVSFLFPWALSLFGIGVAGFLTMCVFLAILSIGFA
jgi:NADH-quinone oxidoreductase subunit A